MVFISGSSEAAYNPQDHIVASDSKPIDTKSITAVHDLHE
jgi:hypothetical protein